MYIPKFLKIGNKVFKVIGDISIGLRYRYDGLYDEHRREILLDPLISDHDLYTAFIHEILHACFPKNIVSYDIEEIIVTRLARKLANTLLINKLFREGNVEFNVRYDSGGP